jgi:CAAX protease family protein
MTPFVTDVVSAVLQLLVFTLIPFVVFLFRHDRTVGFARYLGFSVPPARAVRNSVWAVLVMLTAAVGVIYFNDHVRQMLLAPQSVTGRLRLMGPGLETVATLLLIAIVKTSLAEEIFFRGFVAKRLVHVVGFAAGNALQALLFGAVHLLLFRALIGALVFPLAFIFVFSTIGGWIIGFIKERQAGGSIIPGWIAHATANILSYTLIAFVL